eukprot:m.271137 g.271137  ORF g.271137 m.271137 type:complete len:733 (+) comp51036_c0_seq1:289-2487(+)
MLKAALDVNAMVCADNLECVRLYLQAARQYPQQFDIGNPLYHVNSSPMVDVILDAFPLLVHFPVTREHDSALHVCQSAEVAEALLRRGAHVNARNSFGETPLLKNIRYPAIARVLLRHHADVNAVRDSGATPLHFVQDPCICKELVARGASVHAEDNRGRTPLLLAERVELVRILLAAGAQVNAKNAFDQTLLHSTFDKEIAKELIAAGADVNALDTWGRTALSGASVEVAKLIVPLAESKTSTSPKSPRPSVTLSPLHEVYDVEVARLLVAAGHDPHSRAAVTERSCLHYASSAALVDFFVHQCKIDPNVKSRAGRTPLFELSSLFASSRLIELGADINVKDYSHNSVLHTAPAHVCELLITKYGMDPNVTNLWGDTPLHVCNSLAEASVFVLHAPLMVFAKNDLGETPLHTCTSREIAELLCKRFWCSPEPVDYDGNTPLHTIEEADVIRVVCAMCVNLEHLNNNGWTPLLSQCQRDTWGTGTIEVLLDAGANLDYVSPEGHTALTIASSHDGKRFSELAKILIERGISIPPLSETTPLWSKHRRFMAVKMKTAWLETPWSLSSHLHLCKRVRMCHVLLKSFMLACQRCLGGLPEDTQLLVLGFLRVGDFCNANQLAYLRQQRQAKEEYWMQRYRPSDNSKSTNVSSERTNNKKQHKKNKHKKKAKNAHKKRKNNNNNEKVDTHHQEHDLGLRASELVSDSTQCGLLACWFVVGLLLGSRLLVCALQACA